MAFPQWLDVNDVRRQRCVMFHHSPLLLDSNDNSLTGPQHPSGYLLCVPHDATGWDCSRLSTLFPLAHGEPLYFECNASCPAERQGSLEYDADRHEGETISCQKTFPCGYGVSRCCLEDRSSNRVATGVALHFCLATPASLTQGCTATRKV